VAQKLPRARLILRMHDPDLRPRIAIAARGVAEPFPVRALIRPPVADRGLDAVLGHELNDALDVCLARRCVDLTHDRSRYTRSGVSLRRRIKPSCAVDATRRPSSLKIMPRARPRAPCAVGLSHE